MQLINFKGRNALFSYHPALQEIVSYVSCSDDLRLVQMDYINHLSICYNIGITKEIGMNIPSVAMAKEIVDFNTRFMNEVQRKHLAFIMHHDQICLWDAISLEKNELNKLKFAKES